MLDLRLLGTFTLTIAGSPAPPPRAQAGCWLLALLVLHRGAPVDRDWLAATLWPDSLAEQGRYNLRRNLTDLRRVLGDQASRLRSPTSRTLALDLSDAYCDVLAFDAAVSRQDWVEAIRLYAGTLVPRCDLNRLAEERERREADYGRALDALANREMGQGRWAEAVGYLRRLLERQPTREPTVRALMRALADSGDRGEALKTYRGLRLRLREELLGEPEAETTALYEAIRSRESASVSGNDAPTSEASSGAWVRPPTPPTQLRGRESELATVADLLHKGRWVTLVGMGGIGKTRLALEIALRESDRAVWIELASLRDQSLLPATVGQALNLPQDTDLTTALANRNVLLVLDNCEHLPGAVTALGEALLSAGPGPRLLCTSREPLNGSQEVLFRVPPLQEEAARILFRERALALNPNYAPNADTDALCRAMEGWPLAIELAAAQTRGLPPDRILERLHHLTVKRRATPERLWSLQATLDWSWDLLSPGERETFCRLSTFAGGWTLDAAEAVCPGSLDALASLVDKSLVGFDGRRYTMREPVRQYAAERWEDAADRAAVRERYRAYFVAFAETNGGSFRGPQEREVRERLLVERDNLRHVLAGGGVDGLRVACALFLFWIVNGAAVEGEYWLEGLLRDYSEPDALRASGLYCFGQMACARFHWDVATERANDALQMYREIGDDAGIARTLALVGSIQTNIGQWTEAGATLQEALPGILQSGDVGAEANCRESLGFVARSLGDYGAAERHFSDAMTLYKKQGYEGGYVSAASQMAFVRMGQGDLAAGRDLLREVLRGYQSLSVPAGIAWTLCCLGSVERQLGNLDAARVYVSDALERYQEAGNSTCWPRLEMARTLIASGETATGHALLLQARAEALASGAQAIADEANSDLQRLLTGGN